MQKWYDEGYFAHDLLMRRTHLDTDWISVAELSRRSGGDKIFLAQRLQAAVPLQDQPSLGRIRSMSENLYDAGSSQSLDLDTSSNTHPSMNESQNATINVYRAPNSRAYGM